MCQPLGECIHSLGHRLVHRGKLFPYQRATPPSPRSKSAEKKTSDYDWLRANFPEQGVLVAKIRAEYTMFHSFAAVCRLTRAISFPLDSLQLFHVG
jgi:hypothetical protein